MKNRNMPYRDRLSSRARVRKAKSKHEDDTLDEALKESFPASDPIAVSFTHIELKEVVRRKPLYRRHLAGG